jgi:UDP-N-acetylglucosamine diphosphorylase/glucosamine-1-phosphate N-acetyltransferase
MRRTTITDNPIMPTPALVIFDDARGRWGPLGDRRALFELRTGALTTLERIEHALGLRAESLAVPAPLEALVAQRTGRAVNTPLRNALAVNGRCIDLTCAAQILKLPPGAALLQPDGRLVAAHLSDAVGVSDLVAASFDAPKSFPAARRLDRQVLVDRPWQILERLPQTLTADIDAMALPPWLGDPRVHTLGRYAIKVAADARVHPMVVLNAEKGPIAIDASAIIGSFCVIAGPCYIGRHTIVQPQTHVRATTSIGPECLVAGEISHSIIQGYSNKAHAGYLGNSFLGEWVNLGADTNASNLKNTYGSVRTRLDAGHDAEDTGQAKLGPIIGDFTRTAIGSRLLTGACFSTGTMIALSDFAPKFTPRFAFLTDGGDPDQRYDIEKFLASARAAMARRKCELTAAEEARLRALHAQA